MTGRVKKVPVPKSGHVHKNLGTIGPFWGLFKKSPGLLQLSALVQIFWCVIFLDREFSENLWQKNIGWTPILKNMYYLLGTWYNLLALYSIGYLYLVITIFISWIYCYCIFCLICSVDKEILSPFVGHLHLCQIFCSVSHEKISYLAEGETCDIPPLLVVSYCFGLVVVVVVIEDKRMVMVKMFDQLWQPSVPQIADCAYKTITFFNSTTGSLW